MAVFSVVIVTAAPTGQASEAGGAFVKIDGREALIRSVELFINRDGVKQVLVVFPPDMLDEAKRKFGGHFGLTGVKIVGGGPRWMDQLAAAGDKIDAEATHVLVHDGARPAVPYGDIDALLVEATKHPVVVTTTPTRSTIVQLDEGGQPMSYLLPSQAVSLATPQVFTREKYAPLGKTVSEIPPYEITMLKGSPLNIRLGGSGDVPLVKAMLNLLPKPKIRAADNPFEEAQW